MDNGILLSTFLNFFLKHENIVLHQIVWIKLKLDLIIKKSSSRIVHGLDIKLTHIERHL